MLFRILILTTIGSVCSLFGAILLLIYKKKWTPEFALSINAYAAGVLLATAFLDLLPEALNHLPDQDKHLIFLPILLAIVGFFILEHTLLWLHQHGTQKVHPTVWMITVGDSLHNFVDGVSIAATYILSPGLGVITAIAVGAHEIPHEIADFSVMISQGLSKSKTVWFNFASALIALLGSIGMFYFAGVLQPYLGQIIAFTSGTFLYIALSDLIPELHGAHDSSQMFMHTAVFIGGILTVLVVQFFIKV